MNKPLASVLAVGLLLAVAPSSEATMKMQKEAKEADMAWLKDFVEPKK